MIFAFPRKSPHLTRQTVHCCSGIIAADAVHKQVTVSFAKIVLIALAYVPSLIQGAIIPLVDFESGYSGDTEYQLHDNADDLQAMEYAITPSPNAVHSGFLDFGDHTTGSGNMMVINGATDADRHFFQSTQFEIEFGSTYTFSFWGRSALTPDSHPAEIEFQLWTSDLANDWENFRSSVVLTADGDFGWQEYTYSWTNDWANGPVHLRLENLQLSATGNDFAIDDISVIPEPSFFTGSVAGIVLALVLFRGWGRTSVRRSLSVK